MPLPLVPLGAALATAAAAAAGRSIARRRAEARLQSIVLVGASASGKTSLARAMSGELFSLDSAPTNSSKVYSLTTGTRHSIHVTDMPGADAHLAWKQHMAQVKPDLVCVLIDYSRVISDDDDYRDAETLAAVVRDMAPKRPRALVLTHTDLVEQTATMPKMAVYHERSQLLARKLMPKRTVGGTLADAEGARLLGREVVSWFQ